MNDTTRNPMGTIPQSVAAPVQTRPACDHHRSDRLRKDDTCTETHRMSGACRVNWCEVCRFLYGTAHSWWLASHRALAGQATDSGKNPAMAESGQPRRGSQDTQGTVYGAVVACVQDREMVHMDRRTTLPDRSMRHGESLSEHVCHRTIQQDQSSLIGTTTCMGSIGSIQSGATPVHSSYRVRNRSIEDVGRTW